MLPVHTKRVAAQQRFDFFGIKAFDIGRQYGISLASIDKLAACVENPVSPIKETLFSLCCAFSAEGSIASTFQAMILSIWHFSQSSILVPWPFD